MSHITLKAIAGLATIQDGGRPGHMHEGVPPGGALVPELLARANGCLENAANDAAIELFGTMTVTAEDDTWLATDDGIPHKVAAGETFAIPGSPDSRVRYLAIRGGFDVPLLLGGRGTLLVARFGGQGGRILKRGDSLGARREPIDAPYTLPPFAPDRDAPIRIVLGPDRARFSSSAYDTLLGSSFTISASSDRTGIRLDGHVISRLDSDGGLSTPMVKGAIQVPASGQPIVLGPDHPTTGGYPIIACVTRADFGRLAMQRPGSSIRFRISIS